MHDERPAGWNAARNDEHPHLGIAGQVSPKGVPSVMGLITLLFESSKTISEETSAANNVEIPSFIRLLIYARSTEAPYEANPQKQQYKSTGQKNCIAGDFMSEHLKFSELPRRSGQICLSETWNLQGVAHEFLLIHFF